MIGPLRVDGKTNEHEAASELLGILPLAGEVVTADALFTHRDACSAVVAAGGDSVLPVKGNQPQLRADVAAAFAPPAGLSPPAGPAAPGGDPRRDGIGQGARPA